MPQYFNNCKTLDEAKSLFWDLAKQLHPDKGGKTEDFQDLQNQFEKFRPESEKFEGESEQWNAPEYSAVIKELLNIPEIIVEICGSFIWLSGNTKPHKEEIKAIETGESLRRGWSKNKEMWYFSPRGYRRKSGGDFSIDQIRNTYGSQTIRKEEERQPAITN